MNKFTQTLRSITSYREFTLVVVLLVMTVFMTLFSPFFLTRANIEAILLGLSVEATIAVGMVILLISGGLGPLGRLHPRLHRRGGWPGC